MHFCGGGGAGGFIYTSKLAVSSGENMKVSVGEGGSGASGYDPTHLVKFEELIQDSVI